MSNKEQSIQRALNDLDLGLFSSIRKAAAYYHVPKSTLAYRRQGRDSIAALDRTSQRLSKEEEKVLVQYIRDLQRQNQCPNRAQIRCIIQKMLQEKGDFDLLGKHYISRFISRHSTLKSAKSRKLNVKRASALDSATIERFFSEFEWLRSEYNIESEDIYNMDETGFQIGQIASNFVIYDPAMGRPVAPVSDNTQWVSIIECIGVDKSIKPYLIFCGRSPEDHMFPVNEELTELIWAFSPKGWTDNELAVDWLKRVFMPQTSRQGRHSILIIDGHDSHCSGEFQYYYITHNIHLLYLPAHASHKLQPLDVGPFAPLSRAYSRAVQEYTPTGLAPLNRAIFQQFYIRARRESFTERNIRAGWKRAGIWPTNKQRLLDDPEIKNFGRTTPEYQPPPVREGPNRLLATPKKRGEIRELISSIEARVTPRTRRRVRKLGHAAVQEHAGAQILQQELHELRKQLHSKEVIKKRSKRLAKEAVQRSWDLEQIKAAREGRRPSRVRITHRDDNSLRICILSDKTELGN
jgi:DDE superfamily endonuclease